MKFLIPLALIAIIPSWAQDSIGCSVEGECVQSSMLNTGSSIELEQACLENCVVSELGNNWKLTKKSMLVDISGTSVQSMLLWRFIFQRQKSKEGKSSELELVIMIFIEDPWLHQLHLLPRCCVHSLVIRNEVSNEGCPEGDCGCVSGMCSSFDSV